MKLGFLMIILTLAENGQFSAAFVNTETMAECEQRAAVVRSILESGDMPIEEMVCRAAATEFEPFAHGMEEFGERHAYLVSFDDETATVEPVASCEAAPAKAGQYCATSTQKIVAAAQ